MRSRGRVINRMLSIASSYLDAMMNARRCNPPMPFVLIVFIGDDCYGAGAPHALAQQRLAGNHREGYGHCPGALATAVDGAQHRDLAEQQEAAVGPLPRRDLSAPTGLSATHSMGARVGADIPSDTLPEFLMPNSSPRRPGRCVSVVPPAARMNASGLPRSFMPQASAQPRRVVPVAACGGDVDQALPPGSIPPSRAGPSCCDAYAAVIVIGEDRQRMTRRSWES